jgi:HEAT repeat protein
MSRSGFILLLLCCLPAFAQDSPDLTELWRVGSLWQVGDNRERVDEARQAIIQAGQPGLDYALSRMDTADTLQIRCLTAVIAGFGAQAVEPLIERVADPAPNVRRNAAELLARLDDRSAAPALLKQAGQEEALAARLAQLAALAKWAEADALPLLIETSRIDNQRARHRSAGLLGEYSLQAASLRLIEMLDDEAYYVRAAATEALRRGPVSGRAACQARLAALLNEPEQSAVMIRRLLPVAATFAHERTPALIRQALGHEDAKVRAAAAPALATWKLGAGRLDPLDAQDVLRQALMNETDPFARTEIRSALRELEQDDR